MHTQTIYAASCGFESACQIPALPPGHRSRDLHGHSYFTTVRAMLPHVDAFLPGHNINSLIDLATVMSQPPQRGQVAGQGPVLQIPKPMALEQ